VIVKVTHSYCDNSSYYLAVGVMKLIPSSWTRCMVTFLTGFSTTLYIGSDLLSERIRLLFSAVLAWASSFCTCSMTLTQESDKLSSALSETEFWYSCMLTTKEGWGLRGCSIIVSNWRSRNVSVSSVRSWRDKGERLLGLGTSLEYPKEVWVDSCEVSFTSISLRVSWYWISFSTWFRSIWSCLFWSWISSLISGSIEGEVQPHGELPLLELLDNLWTKKETKDKQLLDSLKENHCTLLSF